MPTYSKIADLNSLFSQIYEGAYFISRQAELLPRLVEVRRSDSMADRKLTKVAATTTETPVEGVAPTGVTLSKSATDTIAPKIYHHQVALTDERIMTDPDDAMRSAAQEAGLSVAFKIEQDGATQFAKFTKSVGTIATALTVSKVLAGISLLMESDPIGTINVCIHPFEWHNILAELTASGAAAKTSPEMANDAMRQYFVGNWLGANWYLNNAINKADAGKIAGAIFTTPSIVYDERTPMTVEIQRDASIRGYMVNTVVRAGWGVQKPEHGVKLLGVMATPS
jgi:hypothetical protein